MKHVALLQETYQAQGCLFLLDLSDSLPAYEKRAHNSPSSHEAAVAALGNMDRVHQVEAIHRESPSLLLPLSTHPSLLAADYSELKTELSEFLNSFAQQKRVRR